MTRNELIEKLAQSLAGDEWNYPHDKDRYRRYAKAAISTIFAALQEPTEAMIDATGSYYIEDKNRDLIVWNAMLNASPLGEKSE